MDIGFTNGALFSSSATEDFQKNAQVGYVEPANQIGWQPKPLSANNGFTNSTWVTNFHGTIYPVPSRMVLDSFIQGSGASATGIGRIAIYQTRIGNEGFVNSGTLLDLVTEFTTPTNISGAQVVAVTEFELWPGRCVIMTGLSSGSSPSALSAWISGNYGCLNQTARFKSGSVPMQFSTTIPASSSAPSTLDVRSGGLGDVTESVQIRCSIIQNYSRDV